MLRKKADEHLKHLCKEIQREKVDYLKLHSIGSMWMLNTHYDIDYFKFQTCL